MKNLFVIITALFLTLNVFAQSPEKMSYQAVVRDANKKLVKNTAIGMQISILQYTASGTALFVETHNPNTNENGLVSVEIGDGTIVIGDFTLIDWTDGPYFIKTETDPTGGTNYTIEGTSQLLSVPYALHAKTAEGVTGSLDEKDPLFNASVAKDISAVDTANWNNKLAVEADGSVTNEIQMLSISNDTIYLANGGFVKIPTETDPIYTAWNKSTGIVITESQITDLDHFTTTDEIDPVFNNSVAENITAFDTTQWANKVGTETDPAYTAWNKSTGISITESQISDLDHFTNTDETDPVFNNSVAENITAFDTTQWTNKVGTETDPVYSAWNKSTGIAITESQITDLDHFTNADETDPVFNNSVAENITAFDTTQWANKVGTETDPAYTAWNKSTGISITESQISDLDHFTNTDETDPVFNNSVAENITAFDTTQWTNKVGTETDPVYSAWNKSTGIAITESQITDLDHFTNADETDPVFNNSVAENITAFDTTQWANKLGTESDPVFNNSVAENITAFDTTQWSASGDVLTDNDNDTKIQVEESADEDIIRFDVAGTERMLLTAKALEFENNDQSVYIGKGAAHSISGNETGQNVFIGFESGKNTNYSIASNYASYNTFIGYQSGYSNTNGYFNVANGYQSLYSNTTGAFNTAYGYASLYSNTTGYINTANGASSLYKNITGYCNTANGNSSLHNNTTGYDNTANGFVSLYNNTTGYNNTANGSLCLYKNTSGRNNNASGFASLYSNTTGSSNVGIGVGALYKNEENSNLVAIGDSALFNCGYNGITASGNTAVGSKALYSNTSGSSNIGIGTQALYKNTITSNLIAIGNGALYNNYYYSGYYAKASQNIAIGSNSLHSNTEGYSNVAIGTAALFRNNKGNNQVAIGDSALYTNGLNVNYSSSDATDNTAIGSKSLYSNTKGAYNSAIGSKSLYSNTEGDYNTANGMRSLYSNTTGYRNTANGSQSLYSNTTGNSNTANGSQSLYYNTTGFVNTANGYQSLYRNTSGHYNVASGNQSLYYNTTGYFNTANGVGSLYKNTTGNFNTANGTYSLFSNTIGYYNVANGVRSLYSNTTGYSNIAIGIRALYKNTVKGNLVAIGDSALYNNGTGASSSSHSKQNTAVGSKALYANTTGYGNSAVGYRVLYDNTTGYRNTAMGRYALTNNTSAKYNTAIGYTALDGITTGNNNTAVGDNAFGSGSTYTNSTAIGADASPGASNRVRLGNSSVSSIGGYASWSNVSDKRFKKNVKENVSGLEFILKLRPVTYNLDMDALAEFTNLPEEKRFAESEQLKGAELQSGFIAQEVEEAGKSIGYDFHGVEAPKNEKDHYSLRYAEFVVPLVKGMQEQQALIEELLARIEELENK